MSVCSECGKNPGGGGGGGGGVPVTVKYTETALRYCSCNRQRFVHRGRDLAELL